MWIAFENPKYKQGNKMLKKQQELLEQLLKEQKKQATILDEIMSTTQSLMDDVNTIREKL